ncbi:MAG: alpha/beta hydrolase [Betaproteobacteria bacterium]|nr:alpha/beta hydrolase [Betaproteobacteria bacterium]
MPAARQGWQRGGAVSLIRAGGHQLEVRRYEPVCSWGERPPLVMLHEGLGSVAMWRDFPQRLADATGCATVAYSRYGYGSSDPLRESRPVDFMHWEAQETLPELLAALGLVQPILFGHSDGGSIALIHAGSGHPVAGLILLAPHLFVEELSIASIAAAREAYAATDLRQRLARYHADVDGAFRGWNEIWLDPAFREWNIEDYLSRVACPILAIQGEDDEYGTPEQVRRIAARAPDTDLLLLKDCRHSPHRDQPQAVLEASVRLVARATNSA